MIGVPKQHFDFKFTKAYMKLADPKMNILSIDKNSSSFTFNEPIPIQDADNNAIGTVQPGFLEIAFKGIDIDYSFGYRVDSDPNYFDDNGEGIIKLRNLSLTVVLTPQINLGKVQLEINDTIIELENYDAVFQGTSDFADAVTLLMENFKSFFKDQLLNIAGRKLSKIA